jgi:hypothetical protein
VTTHCRWEERNLVEAVRNSTSSCHRYCDKTPVLHVHSKHLHCFARNKP